MLFFEKASALDRNTHREPWLESRYAFAKRIFHDLDYQGKTGKRYSVFQPLEDLGFASGLVLNKWIIPKFVPMLAKVFGVESFSTGCQADPESIPGTIQYTRLDKGPGRGLGTSWEDARRKFSRD
jgi:hypothetical protein